MSLNIPSLSLPAELFCTKLFFDTTTAYVNWWAIIAFGSGGVSCKLFERQLADFPLLRLLERQFCVFIHTNVLISRLFTQWWHTFRFSYIATDWICGGHNGCTIYTFQTKDQHIYKCILPFFRQFSSFGLQIVEWNSLGPPILVDGFSSYNLA